MMRSGNILRYLSCARPACRKAPDPHQHCGRRHNIVRHYADTKKTQQEQASNQTTSSVDTSERLRVRRARPGDTPRVLRFVRDHAARCWPGAPPAQAVSLVLADFVARALAQGHSMLAEQQERQQGWARVRGVAIGTATCPWDAALLERWGRCLRAAPARDLMTLTAHCLRAPALHEKYRVHNILQMTLIVPPDSAKNPEIVRLLVGHAIKRGRDAGFPLLRFDVTNSEAAKALESLNLTKEWENVIGDSQSNTPTDEKTNSTLERNILVYSVFTNPPIDNDSNNSLAK